MEASITDAAIINQTATGEAQKIPDSPPPYYANCYTAGCKSRFIPIQVNTESGPFLFVYELVARWIDTRTDLKIIPRAHHYFSDANRATFQR